MIPTNVFALYLYASATLYIKHQITKICVIVDTTLKHNIVVREAFSNCWHSKKPIYTFWNMQGWFVCYLNSHLKDMHGVKNQMFQGKLLLDNIKIFRCKLCLVHTKIWLIRYIRCYILKLLDIKCELTLHCCMMYSSYLKYRFSLHWRSIFHPLRFVFIWNLSENKFLLFQVIRKTIICCINNFLFPSYPMKYLLFSLLSKTA